jgi:3-oxoadipate enol-lactonase/4-carboxymuconolactone decarboxylase
MPILDLDGCRFHYHVDDFSEPWLEPAPVLLHHAAGGNMHRWRAWVPTLARRHPVVRFDMRGHAGTAAPADLRFALPELAADIARVLDGLGMDKAHLVGASAGGIVSLRFAHDFPDRLHSLTLVASTPRLAQMGADMDAGAWRRILEQQGTRAWLLSDTAKRFGPHTSRQVIEWYADEGEKTPAEVVLALQGCLLAEDLSPLLTEINVPTLILAASQDEITPPDVQQLMVQRMPRAKLEIFDGVGHNMKVEIPEILAVRTLDFISAQQGA